MNPQNEYTDDVSAKLNYNAKNDNDHPKIPKISAELRELVDQKQLDFDEQWNIVKLTNANAEKIEKLISDDPDYIPFAKYIFQHYKPEQVMTNENNALFAVVREIDRDNSTNVWRYKRNRDKFRKVIDYMCDPANDFFERLRKGETGLPDVLAGEEVGGSAVKSLSSKICKYLSEYFSDKYSDYKKDSYYINDSFIRHALLFYMDYYGVERKLKNGKPVKSSHKVDTLSYRELHGLLKNLNKARKEKHQDGDMEKSKLDHIIWYCYKSFKIY